MPYSERDYHYLQAVPGDGTDALDITDPPDVVVYVHVLRGEVRTPDHMGERDACGLLTHLHSAHNRPMVDRVRPVGAGDVFILQPRTGELSFPEGVWLHAGASGWRPVTGGVAQELRAIAGLMSYGAIYTETLIAALSPSLRQVS